MDKEKRKRTWGNGWWKFLAGYGQWEWWTLILEDVNFLKAWIQTVYFHTKWLGMSTLNGPQKTKAVQNHFQKMPFGLELNMFLSIQLTAWLCLTLVQIMVFPTPSLFLQVEICGRIRMDGFLHPHGWPLTAKHLQS